MRKTRFADILLLICCVGVISLTLFFIPRLEEVTPPAQEPDTIRIEEFKILPLSDTFGHDAEDLSREDTIAALAAAFAIQESRMTHTAVSPCGKYVGCLQISNIMVREANNIVGFNCYRTDSLRDDRLDRQGSYGIFKIVQEHHNPSLNVDRAVDIWNKGANDSYRNNIKSNFELALEEENLRNYFDL